MSSQPGEHCCEVVVLLCVRSMVMCSVAVTVSESSLCQSAITGHNLTTQVAVGHAIVTKVLPYSSLKVIKEDWLTVLFASVGTVSTTTCEVGFGIGHVVQLVIDV